MEASPQGATGRPRGTLFGLQGQQLVRLGVVLVVLGLVMFFGSLLPVFLAMSAFTADPFGSAGNIIGAFFLSFCLAGVGILLLFVGAVALRFGMVRPVTTYVATEAAPAIESVARSAGSGLREGFGGLPGTGPVPTETVVRVKCRNCGYLDSEDATYCSKCGQAL